GYIFNYRDHINIYAGTTLNDEKQVFGGYITQLSNGNNDQTINLGLMSRWHDFTLQPLTERISIGGAVDKDESENLVYCNDEYEAIAYLIDSIECPLNYTAFKEYLESRPEIYDKYMLNLHDLDNIISDSQADITRLTAQYEKGKADIDVKYEDLNKKLDLQYEHTFGFLTAQTEYDKKEYELNEQYKGLSEQISKKYDTQNLHYGYDKQEREAKKNDEMYALVDKPKQDALRPYERALNEAKKPYEEEKEGKKKEYDTQKNNELRALEDNYYSQVINDNDYFKGCWGRVQGSNSIQLQNLPVSNKKQIATLYKQGQGGVPFVTLDDEFGTLGWTYVMSPQMDESNPFSGAFYFKYRKNWESTVYTAYLNFTYDYKDESIGNDVLVLGKIEPQILYNKQVRVLYNAHDRLTELRGDPDETEYHITEFGFYNEFTETLKEGDAPKEKYDRYKEPDSYKLLFAGFHVNNGETLTPEILSTAGKYPLETLRDLSEKTSINMMIIPAKERRNDTIIVEKARTKAEYFEIIEGVNLLDGLETAKWSPNGKFVNEYNSIFTEADKSLINVVANDEESIRLYNTYAKYKVADSDITSIDSCKVLASKEITTNRTRTGVEWEWEPIIVGVQLLQAGRFILSKVSKPYLNGFSEIKSVSFNYDKSAGSKLSTELGLGNKTVDVSIRSKDLTKKIIEDNKNQLNKGSFDLE
ncbi:MAG: hypothetical protein LBU40_04995, partial [Methanobrevibacter sp.]|nr:hypothetical protein [Methanobrevibacter sp.]